VDNHTQTDIMGISETDIPVSNIISSPESISLNASRHSFSKQIIECLNGNPILPETHYPMQTSSCSSPEPMNEHNTNGNERLKDCSDDDNLETLGRKVSEIINANRLIVSSMDNGNGDVIIPHRYRYNISLCDLSSSLNFQLIALVSITTILKTYDKF